MNERRGEKERFKKMNTKIEIKKRQKSWNSQMFNLFHIYTLTSIAKNKSKIFVLFQKKTKTPTLNVYI